MIGKFDSSKDAEKALELLDEATAIATADEQAGRITAGKVSTKFSNEMLDLCSRRNFSWFGYGDPEELIYAYKAKREGDKLIITTEESEIAAFIKIMLHGGAKIEVYSAHDHGGRYGRATRT